VVHVSERAWELGKNYRTDLAVQANVKETLRAALPLVRARRSPAAATQAAGRLAELKARNWSAQRAKAAVDAMMDAETTPIDPRYLMLRLSEQVPADGVVVEEALTSSVSLPGFLRLADRHAFFGLASGGLGFAMPGAIGVSLALPGRRVTAVVGDGSAMYGIQALWTAAHLKLPITYVIANNRSYRILKERLVSMRATDRFVGMDLRDPAIDYTGLAQSMGVAARRVTDPNDVTPALREAAARSGPSLVEMMVADGFGT
jgi:benzoylformate decarboxylase